MKIEYNNLYTHFVFTIQTVAYNTYYQDSLK